MPRSMVHPLICALIPNRPRPPAFRRGQSYSLYRRMLLGQVRVQSRQMPAERLGRVHRIRHQRGMDAAGAQIRTYAHPAQGRILESRLGSLESGVNPGWRARSSLGVERGEGLAGCLFGSDAGKSYRTAVGIGVYRPTACRVAHES